MNTDHVIEQLLWSKFMEWLSNIFLIRVLISCSISCLIRASLISIGLVWTEAPRISKKVQRVLCDLESELSDLVTINCMHCQLICLPGRHVGGGLVVCDWL